VLEPVASTLARWFDGNRADRWGASFVVVLPTGSDAGL
jgi:hypothetical protein